LLVPDVIKRIGGKRRGEKQRKEKTLSFKISLKYLLQEIMV
jgi:hypothetical protein